MADEHGKGNRRDGALSQTVPGCKQQCQHDRKPALARVTGQRQHCGEFAAAAQHVGRPGVARPVAVRIGQAESLADNHGE